MAHVAQPCTSELDAHHDDGGGGARSSGSDLQSNKALPRRRVPPLRRRDPRFSGQLLHSARPSYEPTSQHVLLQRVRRDCLAPCSRQRGSKASRTSHRVPNATLHRRQRSPRTARAWELVEVRRVVQASRRRRTAATAAACVDRRELRSTTRLGAVVGPWAEGSILVSFSVHSPTFMLALELT